MINFKDKNKKYILEVLVSLLHFQNSNHMWFDRSIRLIDTTITLLDYLRKKNNIEINTQTIEQFLSLDKLVEYSKNPDIDDETLNALKKYFNILPSFKFELSLDKQPEVIFEQHNFYAKDIIPVLHFIDKFNTIENHS